MKYSIPRSSGFSLFSSTVWFVFFRNTAAALISYTISISLCSSDDFGVQVRKFTIVWESIKLFPIHRKLKSWQDVVHCLHKRALWWLGAYARPGDHLEYCRVLGWDWTAGHPFAASHIEGMPPTQTNWTDDCTGGHDDTRFSHSQCWLCLTENALAVKNLRKIYHEVRFL